MMKQLLHAKNGHMHSSKRVTREKSEVYHAPDRKLCLVIVLCGGDAWDTFEECVTMILSMLDAPL